MLEFFVVYDIILLNKYGLIGFSVPLLVTEFKGITTYFVQGTQ